MEFSRQLKTQADGKAGDVPCVFFVEKENTNSQPDRHWISRPCPCGVSPLSLTDQGPAFYYPRDALLTRLSFLMSLALQQRKT